MPNTPVIENTARRNQNLGALSDTQFIDSNFFFSKKFQCSLFFVEINFTSSNRLLVNNVVCSTVYHTIYKIEKLSTFYNLKIKNFLYISQYCHDRNRLKTRKEKYVILHDQKINN